MRSLGIGLWLDARAITLWCPALGIPKTTLEMTTTGHTVFDMAWIRGKIRSSKLASGGTFAVSDTMYRPKVNSALGGTASERSTSVGSTDSQKFSH